MNLVEISEMLKGAPDSYLTKHVQAPDGSVPQYLALAELQRRQDMRARFAQQNPQSTVAEDATKGIAAAAPDMVPPAPPAMAAPPAAPAQPQGFAEGGEVGVQDNMIDRLLRGLGLRNLPSEKAAYERTARAAGQRLSNTESNVSSFLRKHRLNMQREEDRALTEARSKMAAPPPPPDPLQAMIAEREALLKMTPAQRAAKEAADSAAFQKAQMDEFMEYMKANPEEFELGFRAGNKFKRDPVPSGGGYERGGLVENYISRAGKFESGNNRSAKNPFSTASGRFQFIDSTRRALDKKYGFDPKDRSDKTEEARMKAYTQETIDALEKGNIPVTGGTLYGGHFLGQKGIVDFFEAYKKDPNTKVEDFFSAKIISKNPAIFNPRKAPRRRTLAEVMNVFDQVGGGKTRTPMSDEDMNLGAAVQVAQRADRGDVGAYEDMNMSSALALAKDLEKKPGRQRRTEYAAAAPKKEKAAEAPSSAMAALKFLTESKGPAAQPTFFFNPAEDALNKEIRDQLLAPYRMPFGSDSGYAGGGPVEEEERPVYDEFGFRVPQSKNKYDAAKGGESYFTRAEKKKKDEENKKFIRDTTFGAVEGIRNFVKNPTNPSTYLPAPVVGIAGAIGNAAKEAVTDPLGPVQTARREVMWAMPGLNARIEAITGQPGAPLFNEAGQLNLKKPEPPPPDPYDVMAREFLDEVKKNQTSKEDLRSMALLQAGLGMMAGESPFFFTNVGRGAAAGLQAYQQGQAQNRDMAEQALGNAMKARALGLEARKVKSSEASAAANAEYQRSMMDYNKSRAEAMLARAKATGGITREQEITYRHLAAELLRAAGVSGEISEDKFYRILEQAKRGVLNYGVSAGPSFTDFEEGPNVSDTATEQ